MGNLLPPKNPTQWLNPNGVGYVISIGNIDLVVNLNNLPIVTNTSQLPLVTTPAQYKPKNATVWTASGS